MNVSGPSVIRYLDVNSAQYQVTNISEASEASLAYAVGAHDDRPGEGYLTYARYSGATFQDEVNDVRQGLMGFRDIFGNRCDEEEFYASSNYTPFISNVRTSYTVNVCANRPGLDNTVTIRILLEGRLGSNTQFISLGGGSIQVSLIGENPEATSLPPSGDCFEHYYRISWNVAPGSHGTFGPFDGYRVSYSVGSIGAQSASVSNRQTTSYMITGVTGADVGDVVVWRVSATYSDEDDDGNVSGTSTQIASGMGTMQECPSGPPTDTFTPAPGNCNPPRNMTFNRYNTGSRVIYFDFTSPVSGGLNRLHFQPQYRRLPSTTWTDASFTVAANNTSWALIFNNESFTFGRTIEFRLLSVCTGAVESDPSNVVSYTYPAEPGTATSTFTPVPSVCQPPRNMTFNRYADSTRFIYFDFDAPVSGGLNRLHYQPQYRRLPSTGWTDVSFTVAANNTSWAVRFTNESFTTGRTIEFRLLSVCTGDVRSDPSNVISYTYPGPTPTNTNTPSGPTATHTPTPITTSDCRSATNFRRSSTSSDGFDVTYAWTRPTSGETISAFRREWRETTDNPSAAWVSADVFSAAITSFSLAGGPILAGRTFQNRVITICGSNTSAPSNHTTYTYPEAEDNTATPTNTSSSGCAPVFNVRLERLSDTTLRLTYNRPLTPPSNSDVTFQSRLPGGTFTDIKMFNDSHSGAEVSYIVGDSPGFDDFVVSNMEYRVSIVRNCSGGMVSNAVLSNIAPSVAPTGTNTNTPAPPACGARMLNDGGSYRDRRGPRGADRSGPGVWQR